MSTPHISVVMPVFNGTRFIRRAYESLRTQTLIEWELLAVDDGSAATETWLYDQADRLISHQRGALPGLSKGTKIATSATTAMASGASEHA